MNTHIDLTLAIDANEREHRSELGLLATYGLIRPTDSRVPDATRRGRRENRRRRHLH